MLAFVVLGGPNFGKGTVSTVLKTENFFHINSGEYMRERLRTDLQFRSTYKGRMDQGYFLPDDVANSCFDDMVRRARLTLSQNTTIDGLFRTGPQFKYGISKLGRMDLLPIFIELHKLSLDDAWARAQKRAETEGRLDDLDFDVFTRRYGLYHAHLADVRENIKAYDLSVRYHRVRVNREPEQVAQEIMQILSKYRPLEQDMRNQRFRVVQPEIGCGS